MNKKFTVIALSILSASSFANADSITTPSDSNPVPTNTAANTNPGAGGLEALTLLNLPIESLSVETLQNQLKTLWRVERNQQLFERQLPNIANLSPRVYALEQKIVRRIAVAKSQHPEATQTDRTLGDIAKVELGIFEFEQGLLDWVAAGKPIEEYVQGEVATRQQALVSAHASLTEKVQHVVAIDFRGTALNP